MRISQKKKKFQQKLKALIKKYVKLLKLEKWHIDTIISKDDLITSKRGKIVRSKADYYAEVIYNYLTKYATVTLTRLQTVDEPEELSDTILHELLHIKMSVLLQITESLIAVSGFNKDKATQLIAQVDEAEHDIIETIIQLYDKKEKTN